LFVKSVLASAFPPADFLAACFRHYLFTPIRVSDFRLLIRRKVHA
jgi:hypothetical protein